MEVHDTGDAAMPNDFHQAPEATEPALHAQKRHETHSACKLCYLMEFWFTKHSMHALRRHRKHSVMSCRLDARSSTWAGSLQASSTA